MDLLLIGVSHKTAPVAVRDELSMDPEEIGTLLPLLLTGRDTVAEVAVLSTCNRTELYGVVEDPASEDRLLRDAINKYKGVSHFNNGEYTYSLTGRDVAIHLFRVASGLESLMVGESQILGQVRESLDIARRGRSAGVLITRLFNAAVTSGKRARAETAISEGAVSVAYAAVRTATKVFVDLSQHQVLLVGAGETATLAGRHFADEGPAGLLVVNRTLEQAQRLAGELGGTALPWSELEMILREADIVICATASPEPVITTDDVKRAMKKRAKRPQVIVDIATPRDVEPEVAALDNVFLYDMDALQSIVEQNMARRTKEIPKVESIVEDEIGRFFEWYDALRVMPVIKALHACFEEVGLTQARRQARHFGASDREELEKFTRSLISKFLHNPTMTIKGLDPSTHSGFTKLAAIQELFKLDLSSFADPHQSREDNTEGNDRS